MYDDISKVSYKQMRAQVTRGEEYKGPQGPSKLKQYPIGGREYSQRFFVEGPDGVFHVYYRKRLAFRGIVEERGLEVCRIHPDNSLEFVNVDWMSRQQYLGAMLCANVMQSSKHGGVILGSYSNTAHTVHHPVFKGLRVTLDGTFTALTPYTVDYRRLNQAVAKEEFAKYARFVQLTPILIEAMSVDGFFDMYVEHQDATAVAVKEEHYTRYETLKGQLMGRVLETIEAGHYVDALCLYALHVGRGLGFYRRPFSDRNTAYVRKENIMNHVRAHLVKFKDDMLRATPEVFKHVPRKEGESLKTSKWGYDIRTVQADAFTGTRVTR
jgi:hypothetical protein